MGLEKEDQDLGFEWGKFSRKAFLSLVKSNKRLNIWFGSVRSGKTITSLVRWISFIKNAPRGRLLMVGKTERTLKRNILDDLRAMVGKKNYKKCGDGTIKVFGRTIDLVGANDERSESKIRGATYAGAYCDEITLFPESFFKMLMSRLSVKGAKLFGTTNPDSPFHWFKRDYLDNKKLDLIQFHFTMNDNINLDPDYVENLKKEYTGVWYKRMILGLWCLAAGAIYQNYDEDIHKLKNLPATPYKNNDINDIDASNQLSRSFDKLFVGVDYGINNPTTFVLIGKLEDKYYVIKEFYHDSKLKGQKTDKHFAHELKKFIQDHKVSKIFVDPSALSFKVELQEHGIYTTDANNDVLNGIRKVGSLIESQKLFIHNSCENLNREFQSYLWDEKAQKKGEDKPVKEHDHALDALRYVIYTLECDKSGDIKDVIAKDKVKSYSKYK
jgi:PBSX family phage terminase large subunit